MVMTVLSAATAIGAVSAQKPAKPANLEAAVTGHKVTLNWDNPDAGQVLLETGFEGEAPFDGWTIDSTNRYDSIFTWFSFPDPRFLPEEGMESNYKEYIYNGEKSAMVYYDPYVRGTHKRHQDEWLISPVCAKAAYLTFHYFIDPMILQYATDPEFPDHYVVVVSKDGGETWGEPIWDAREDASETYGWATAVLALDETPTDQMKIAFRAYGDYRLDPKTGDTVNEGLYFQWCIDDVSLTSSLPAATEAVAKAAPKAAPAGKTYREYVPARPVAARAAKRTNPHAKMPVIRSYNILLDGEVLAEGIMNLTYTDKSEKTVGEHVYQVVAVSGEESSEPASVKVELKEAVFAQPRNVVLTAEEDEMAEDGSYVVTLSWEAPEGDFQPVYYNIYCDGDQIGWEITDLELSQFGYTSGIYEFAVEAVYEVPDGVSEQVTRYLAIDVRFGVTDLKAEVAGEDVVLTWGAPREDGHAMGTYTVYRAGDKMAENLKETTFRDKAVPAGLYQYTVIAVYEDKVESVRTAVGVQVGEMQRVTLPYEQKFTTTFCPKDLQLVNLSESTPDKYGWYFDDGSRLGVKGAGFDGCYAAVDCNEAGFYPIDAALELPAIDLTNVTEKADMVLAFNYSYATSEEDMAGMEWSLDGTEWYVLMELEAYNPEEVEDGDFQIKKMEYALGEADEKVLAAIKAGETLYLRFHYTATAAYHLAVDNIVITGPVADTTDPGTAVEGLEEAGVTVSAAYGQVQVQAASDIRSVEVYAMNGLKLAARAGNGGTEMTLPVAFRGAAVIRVTTAQGVKHVKMLL